MVFILEPVFWVAAGVPLAMMIQRRPVRYGLLGLLGAALLWCAGAGFLHWSSLVLLGLVGLAVGALSGRAKPDARRGLVAGIAACLAFVAIQGAGSARGVSTLAAELRKRDAASELVDASMTAYPANPLCWNFVAVERNEAAGIYRLRRGVLSLAPALLDVAHCPAGLTGNVRAEHAFPGMALLSDDSVDLARLRRLEQENCFFRDWLRFARAPLVSGDVASDIRFGTTLAPNFSTIDLARFAGRSCPANVPQWDFPRADLLRARQ
jgi:inner membrane protein